MINESVLLKSLYCSKSQPLYRKESLRKLINDKREFSHYQGRLIVQNTQLNETEKLCKDHFQKTISLQKEPVSQQDSKKVCKLDKMQIESIKKVCGKENACREKMQIEK